MKKKLYDLAHCRAGDKGNTSILSLFAYRDEDYPLLCSQVTAQAVKRHLAHIINGNVTRYEVPNVGALQFVCEAGAGRRRHHVARDGRARQEPVVRAARNGNRGLKTAIEAMQRTQR